MPIAKQLTIKIKLATPFISILNRFITKPPKNMPIQAPGTATKPKKQKIKPVNLTFQS